jgi:hypothetical protein
VIHSQALSGVNPQGDLMVWNAALAGAAPPRPRIGAAMIVFGLGLAVTTAGAMAVWQRTGPDAVVSTRILADSSSSVGARNTLAETALRFVSVPGHPVTLEDGGTALVVTAQDPDPAVAQSRAGSLVDTILGVPVASPPSAAVLPVTSPLGTLAANRNRLLAAIDAVDAQSVSLSGRLTDLVRDMAAGARTSADRRPGREALDKGNATLADLQLQRIQLLTRYQADFPAVVALDGQIQSLRAFLTDQAKRSLAPSPIITDPAAPMLTDEMNRVKASLAGLDDRRRNLMAELVSANAAIAALPPEQAAVLAPVAPPAPMLVQAATTMGFGPDPRLVIIPAIAAAGLVLSALIGLIFLRRRAAPASMQPCFLLEQVEGGGTVLTRVLPQAYRAIGDAGPMVAPLGALENRHRAG